MTEETDAPEMGGAEESADTSMEAYVREREAEENPEAATGQQTDAEEGSQADDTGEEAAPKRVPWFQKRIDEVTRQKYDAQREADYWRGVAEGRIQPQQSQAPQQVGPPQPEHFDDWDQYEAAKTAYLADMVFQQRMQQVFQQHERGQVLRTFEERQAAARQALPDYDAVALNPNVTITPLMAEVIRESDVGPQVAYHLGSNPQEAAKIAALPPHRQAAALGKIEASIEKSQPAQRSVPPPPPRTVGGIASGGSKSPEKMSMAEYVAWRRSQDQ